MEETRTYVNTDWKKYKLDEECSKEERELCLQEIAKRLSSDFTLCMPLEGMNGSDDSMLVSEEGVASVFIDTDSAVSEYERFGFSVEFDGSGNLVVELKMRSDVPAEDGSVSEEEVGRYVWDLNYLFGNLQDCVDGVLRERFNVMETVRKA